MKTWQLIKRLWKRINVYDRVLDDLPAPDFNVKIIFYEK